ncbi:hypothetical protein [Marinobacter sp. AC-23]|uniref:hypothetical protein n=1 Tax=Marinobacter sp. AC-23 TaxID=1879031 RepID=UPI0008DE27EA|nr:hypothetical protein [Marinobacter sp. AC-23]OHY73664.1 hypothetical protein BCA33_18390 [Marinobacter sp. AC-23]
MKKLFILATVVTLSTSVLADNMSDNKDMKAMHHQMTSKQSIENILQNEDMQRLHKNMTLYAMSEVGMEARRQMISTEEGQAYHKAMENGQKNTAR